MKQIWIALLLIASGGSANAQDKPNVVVILSDNVGYGDIGAYGAGEIRGMPTPRLDQLASSDPSSASPTSPRNGPFEAPRDSGGH